MNTEWFELYLKKTNSQFKKDLDLVYLRELQVNHLNTFAFEGINSLLGMPVPLDLESLVQKFIFHERGGYCFEQNNLFKTVIENLGFKVNSYLGRVIEYNINNGRTHMINVVELQDGKYLVDVGFGGLNPDTPLKIEKDLITKTNLNTYRIIDIENTFYLQALVKGEWKNLYSFDFNNYTFGDYEVANWYTSTSPNTTFTQNLTASIIHGNNRYSLKNRLFSVWENGKLAQKQLLSTSEEIENILNQYFNINVSDLPNWEKRISEILMKAE